MIEKNNNHLNLYDKRALYAQSKCQAIVRDHEDEISVIIPSTAKSKIIVLGNSGVGKTSIIYSHKYGGSELISCNATIGASYVNCDVTVQNNIMSLQIWDTAGQERFRCMVPMYMRNAAAAIIVYDICDRKSFEDVDRWVAEIKRGSGCEDTVLVLLGNKLDLQDHREVAVGEGITKAAKISAKFYEISAYDSTLIDQIFCDVAEELYTRHKVEEMSESEVSSSHFTIKLPSPRERRASSRSQKAKKSSCCVIS